MKLLNAIIEWTPGGEVNVRSHPDPISRSDGVVISEGAGYADWHKLTAEQRELAMFICFNTIVRKGEIDPKVVHKAFMEINEYSKHIAAGNRNSRN